MKYKIKKLKRFVTPYSVFLLVILLLALFLRLYNFENRIGTDADSNRDAFVALVGARELQMPITGPFISIAPVTTGPWYWIQLILFSFITRSFYAPWIYLVLLSLLTIIIMYYIGILLENKKLGLILAFLTAIAPQQILIGMRLMNPSAIPFYASLAILIFLYLIKIKSHKIIFILLGFVLGIMVNTHYQALALALSILFLLVIFQKNNRKMLIYSVVFFIITFLPLVIFELTNHWYNTRHMWQYLTVDQYKIWVPFSWKIYLSKYWPEFISFVLGGKLQFGACLMFVIFTFYLVKIIKRTITLPYILLGISFFVQVVVIRYYRGEKFYGYLQFFHPFLFIFLGHIIYSLGKIKPKRIWAVLFLILYLYNTIPTIYHAVRSQEHTTLQAKIDTQNILKTFGPGPYKILKCGNAFRGEIEALVLNLYINNLYDSNSPKVLAYLWGCKLPKILKNGEYIFVDELPNVKDIYPQIGLVANFSDAIPKMVTEAGWLEVSPNKKYQSAARWWMDEQP